MYCNHCGKVIQEDANHCAYCGGVVGRVVAQRKLRRPREGRQIAGVCKGLAEYFDLDVVLIRLMLVACVVFGGFGLFAYVVAWIMIPNERYAVSASVPANTSAGRTA